MEHEHPQHGPPESVRAAAAALRSRRHAEMLFDLVVAQLGDAAWLETADGGAIRRLFRRDPVDPTLIVPCPVLELKIGGRFGMVTDWMPTGDLPFPPPEPRTAPPPRLRGLGPGEIRLVDGAEHIEIVYDDQGAKFETCRSHHPHPLAGIVPALAARGASPTELLAQFFATLDPGRHDPGRVHLPAAMPGGAAGVWSCGLGALRRTLFHDIAARGARWAVADGLTGTTHAFGATREEALSRWRAALAVRSPWPEPTPVPDPPSEPPPGTIVLRGPSPDVPMPDAVPENVPAVIVPVAAAPSSPPAVGAWTTLLGARGATSFAACRREGKGFTAIGQHLLADVDLDRLGAELDRVDANHEERLREVFASAGGAVVRRPCRTTIYQVGDDGRLALDMCSESSEWHAGHLDGDVVARRIVRQRWTG